MILGMSTPAHTPGPWAVERDGKQWAVKRPGLRAVYMMRKTKEAAQKACDEANERHRVTLLHEAAPDMLELLKWLNRNGGLGHTIHDLIRAAIAKAEGQS